MPRVYLPLLPLPVLALVVAFSACSRSRTDDAGTHVIPPAAPAVSAPSLAPAAPPPARGNDEPPSAEELREFERPVAK